MSDDSLFPDLEIPPPPVPVQMTPGERLREKQTARIRAGQHPLSYGGAIIPLHPDAPRVEHDDGVKRGELRCGSCAFRQLRGGHARSFPKCMYGRTVREIPEDEQTKWGPKRVISEPRASGGLASDVRAWWPACSAYQREEEA